VRYAFACCADQAGLIRKGGDIADLTPRPLFSVPTDEGNSLVSLRDKATVGCMAAIRVIGLEVLRLSMGQSMDAAGMMIRSQAVVPNQLNSTSPRSSFPLARREGCMLSVKRSDISQQFLGDIQGFHRIFP
jgi:hypothetical protein